MSITEKLINQIPTDTSGRWVRVEDLPQLVALTVNEAAKFTDHAEELHKHFGDAK